jgi:hypothetical protein
VGPAVTGVGCQTVKGSVLERGGAANEISAAWGIKERLAQMLRAHGPNGYIRQETSTRRTRCLAACVGADLPEATRLAGTIEKWWPEIEAFLPLGITSARTEGCNRVIKQIKRVACGFRNQDNYEWRIMLHGAARRVASTSSGRGQSRSSTKLLKRVRCHGFHRGPRRHGWVARCSPRWC